MPLKIEWFLITFIVAFFLVTTAVWAQEPSEELPVATIIGHKVGFGANKKEVTSKVEILKDVDPSLCVSDAALIQQAYRANETSDADRVGAKNWVLASSAICSKTLKMVPSQTITVLGVCEVIHDPDSNLTAREQLEQACL